MGLVVDNWPGVACQPAYDPLDVIGLNEYFGLFQQGGGTTDDRDALSSYLDFFRSCYPQKALFVTEFGFDGNRNGPVEEYGTYQFQSNMLAFHLGVLASKSWLSGAMIQTLQDYPSYPYYNGSNPFPNSSINGKGIVDLYGNFKPAASVVSSVYHSTAQVRSVTAGGPLVVNVKRQRGHDHAGARLEHRLHQPPALVVQDLVSAL